MLPIITSIVNPQEAQLQSVLSQAFFVTESRWIDYL